MDWGWNLMAKQKLTGLMGEVISPGMDASFTHQAGEAEAFDRMSIALAIALLADLLQLVFMPLFVEGALSGLDDAVDFAVGIALIRLLGWHWVFLPSLVTKLVPGLDELPCWTMAVLFVRAERTKSLKGA